MAGSFFSKCKPPTPVLSADYVSPPWSYAYGYPVLAGWPSTCTLPGMQIPRQRASFLKVYGCYSTSARGRRAERGAAKRMPVLKTLNSLWDAGDQKSHRTAPQVGGGPRCQQWHMVRDPGTVEGCASLPAGPAGLWGCRPPPLSAQSPVPEGGEKSSGRPPAQVPFLLCPRHHFPPSKGEQ